MAHSMGTWLAVETLRQMAIRDGRVPVKIQQVILASPDLDVDVFGEEPQVVLQRDVILGQIAGRGRHVVGRHGGHAVLAVGLRRQRGAIVTDLTIARRRATNAPAP